MVKTMTGAVQILKALTALMLAGLAFSAAVRQVAKEFGITSADVRRIANAAGLRW
jgi:predicted transcriptional regulator